MQKILKVYLKIEKTISKSGAIEIKKQKNHQQK